MPTRQLQAPTSRAYPRVRRFLALGEHGARVRPPVLVTGCDIERALCYLLQTATPIEVRDAHCRRAKPI